MDEDSVMLARIDQKVIALEDWQDQHAKDDDKREADANVRFERIFNYIKDRHDKTDKKLEELWDTRNRNVGGGKVLNYLVNLAVAIVAAIGAVKVMK